MSTFRSVVVTGIGVISSLGKNKNDFFNNICLGKNASAPITSTNTENYRKRNAAEIKETLAVPEAWRTYSRACQMALLAVTEALEDARLTECLPQNAGISIGTMNGGSPEVEEWYCNGRQKTLEEIDVNLLRNYPLHSIAELIAAEFSLTGLKNTVMTACASGTSAIGIGLKWIRQGRADVVICGGVDAFRPLTHLGLASFRIITPDIVRPFSKSRKGILVGEGAGILVLESEENAKKRGAKWYCSVAGFGATCDANDLAHPLDDGFGMFQAMNKAVESANISVGEIDYINAHGTGTAKNDIAELLAIKKLMRDFSKTIFVGSIKGSIGHTIGAAGGIEAVATILSIRNKCIPPNINCEDPEMISNSIIIPKEKVNMPVKVAISNSFGFGGNNVSIIFKEYNSK